MLSDMNNGPARLLRSLALAGTAVLVASGCVRGSGEPSEQLTVAVTLAPLAEIVRTAGGVAVDVVELVPPSADAHDHELTAKQADALSRADLVVYLGGFQPGIEKTIKALDASVMRLDLMEVVETLEGGHSHAEDDHSDEEHTDDEEHSKDDTGSIDPHVWLDPANMVLMAGAVTDAFDTLNPDINGENAEALAAWLDDLEGLGSDIETRLAACERRLLVTTHDAFGYLANRADLETLAVRDSEDSEPTSRELDDLVARLTDTGTTTIFHEPPAPDNLTSAVADRVKARLLVLDPLETVSAADTEAGRGYLAIQRDNLSALVEGLGCPG
jgi:zinc transport system substrate-binding protein